MISGHASFTCAQYDSVPKEVSASSLIAYLRRPIGASGLGARGEAAAAGAAKPRHHRLHPLGGREQGAIQGGGLWSCAAGGDCEGRTTRQVPGDAAATWVSVFTY